jgi:hypothetical protein
VYAETASMRTRQALADAGVLVWMVVWIRIGRRVHDLIGRLGAPGQAVEDAGSGLAEAAGRGGAAVSDIPFVGRALGTPFEGISAAGSALARAGTAQQEAVADLAFWLGALVAALPVLWALSRYVPWRLAWIRAAAPAARLRAADPDGGLFALRALASRPLRDLRRVEDDPFGAYQQGRYRALAAVELEALGLRPRRGATSQPGERGRAAPEADGDGGPGR